jgi:1,4-dihydroxy-2-naphthoyl-CoA hydrolase
MQKTLTFRHPLSIPIQDIDAAGIVFFAHLFRYAHETYEHFMEHVDYPLKRLLEEGQLLLPLVHSEADFRQPLLHGEKLQVELHVRTIKNSSFILGYRMLDENGTERASLETVHVAVDKATRKPVNLPEALRKALAPYRR